MIWGRPTMRIRGIGAFAAAALALPLWGCGGSAAPDDLAARLVGVWVWVESTGGIAGATVTPQDAGYEMRMEFHADGTVRLFRDGSQVGATTFRLEPEPGGTSASIRYAEPLLGAETQEVRFEGADTLLLVDPCCDGFTYRFRREEG